MDTHRWSQVHLPAEGITLVVSNVASCLMVLALWWLIHVTRSNKHEPYSGLMSALYTCFGVSSVALTLSDNIPAIADCHGVLQILTQLLLICVFLIAGLRLKVCMNSAPKAENTYSAGNSTTGREQ